MSNKSQEQAQQKHINELGTQTISISIGKALSDGENCVLACSCANMVDFTNLVTYIYVANACINYELRRYTHIDS